MLCTAKCGVESKGARVGKAIENRLALGDFCDGSSILLLIEKKAGFLTVFNVYCIGNSVFAKLCGCRFGMRANRAFPPRLILRKSLKLADCIVVSLI